MACMHQEHLAHQKVYSVPWQGSQWGKSSGFVQTAPFYAISLWCSTGVSSITCSNMCMIAQLQLYLADCQQGGWNPKAYAMHLGGVASCTWLAFGDGAGWDGDVSKLCFDSSRYTAEAGGLCICSKIPSLHLKPSLNLTGDVRPE